DWITIKHTRSQEDSPRSAVQGGFAVCFSYASASCTGSTCRVQFLCHFLHREWSYTTLPNSNNNLDELTYLFMDGPLVAEIARLEVSDRQVTAAPRVFSAMRWSPLMSTVIHCSGWCMPRSG